MMIDFALAAERNEGLNTRDAIFRACLLRFRPIMMTTSCALLGGMPLALGWGAGAELRKPLGIGIVGGLVVSQMLTLFTTPVIYLYLDGLRKRFSREHRSEFRNRPGFLIPGGVADSAETDPNADLFHEEIDDTFERIEAKGPRNGRSKI